jgi:hypothetical protein
MWAAYRSGREVCNASGGMMSEEANLTRLFSSGCGCGCACGCTSLLCGVWLYRDVRREKRSATAGWRYRYGWDRC